METTFVYEVYKLLSKSIDGYSASIIIICITYPMAVKNWLPRSDHHSQSWEPEYYGLYFCWIRPSDSYDVAHCSGNTENLQIRPVKKN